MRRRSDARRVLAVFVVPLSVVILLSATQVQANQKEGENGAQSTAKIEKKPRKPRGRLPAYYSKVVNEEQRLKIYSIQAQHMLKIKELRAQLAAALEAMNSEVSTVLSEEQRKKVAQLVSEATERRKAKAEANSQPSKTTASK